MANVTIKFNGKEFLLSCDDGQEEHLEELFKDGIQADNEEQAMRVVDAKVKELMYGGPYYSISEDEGDQ